MVQAKLTGVPETLLIPLWARATETGRVNPIVRDDQSVEILSQIDYDFSKLGRARLSQLSVAVRTMLLDLAVRQFLETHPDACVVNLGAGLDTRYARLGDNQARWYELDLPEVLSLRGKFLPEGGECRFLARSVFDEAWMGEVETDGRAVLLIAEGLFMYFREERIRELFAKLVARFPGAEALVEVQGPGIVGKAAKHDSVSKMRDVPEFKWGTADSRELTQWHPSIELVEEWRFFDYHLDRAGWLRWLLKIPYLRRKYEPRIARLRFREADAR